MTTNKRFLLSFAADDVAAAIHHLSDARDILSKDLGEAGKAAELADIEQALTVLEEDILMIEVN